MAEEIVDDINIGRALDMIGRAKSDSPAPYAGCPRCREPLVSTLERAGAEFLCMCCGTWCGFLSPIPLEPTPELDARYAELKARFDTGERP